MSLEHWQKRLHEHFTARASERSASGHPVFALEHGLDAAERDALASEVRASLAFGKPSDAYWLPWIVYATEVGYEYDGEEYWQTFEERTPGWVTCRSRPRDWLRDRFVRFQKTYRGLQPSGRWASWFSIIAWPIQHAILPGYLQYHLAKLLCDLRFDLTPELLADPLALGHYLHEESGQSVKRLQEFAEEYALVGTIATALLLSGNSSTDIAILPGTLERLISDLEREQRARDCLRVARDQARHVSLGGLGPRFTSTPKGAGLGSPITKKDVPELEPRLLVVPSANDEWRVYLETPDVTALTTRFPHFRGILASSRCVVGAGSGRWQTRGWLLHGPHRVPLVAWPQPDEVLLRVENSNPLLDALLRTDFLLRPGPTWLFKISADGIGYEVRSLSVRPGQRYVIVKNDGVFPIVQPAREARVSCTGIAAATIDVPAALEERTASYLEQLGLDVWQTINVWPAGLCASTWDGEGWAEWSTNDPVCIGISSDKPVQSILVVLDDSSLLRVNPDSATAPVFVVLPSLRLGQHHLAVHVQNAWPNPTEQVGHLDFLIRAPRARLDGYRALFRVAMEPERASLDDLWRGAVNVAVYGPDKHWVTPRMELAGGPGLSPIAQKALPRMQMPVSTKAWRVAFRDHCDEDATLGNAFDAAKEGRLCFDAGELGSTTLRFEHERRPLRWHVQRTTHGCTLRLVNESTDDGTTVVELYSFHRPDRATVLKCEDFVAPVATPPPSGLFLAWNQSASAGVITPPATVVNAFGGLGVKPILQKRQQTASDIAGLLQLYERWAIARIIRDALSLSFRRRVLVTIESALCNLLYQETNVLGKVLGPHSEQERLGRLLRSIPEATIRAILPTVSNELLALSVQSRPDCFAKRLCPLLSGVWNNTIRPDNDRLWIAEFALRLASAPQTMNSWAGEILHDGLRFALRHTTFIRAARYVVIAGDGAPGAKPLSAGPLHDGWEWP